MHVESEVVLIVHRLKEGEHMLRILSLIHI